MRPGFLREPEELIRAGRRTPDRRRPKRIAAVALSHSRYTPNVDLRAPDSAGRINIGKRYRGQMFAVQTQPNGDIVLSPVVVRLERDERVTPAEAPPRRLGESKAFDPVRWKEAERLIGLLAAENLPP